MECFSLRFSKGVDMARPKRVEGEKTAYERMEDAFWDMLAEMPYHDMTGKEVRVRAGVSHNTFYYYFENMDDMARKMFDRIVITEAPLVILSVMAGDSTIDDAKARIPQGELRIKRISLLARSGSSLLTDMLRETLINAWLNTVGLEEDDLTEADRMDLTFMFGGVITLLSSDYTDDTDLLTAFAQGEIGQGMFRKMQQLAKRGNDAGRRDFEVHHGA